MRTLSKVGRAILIIAVVGSGLALFAYSFAYRLGGYARTLFRWGEWVIGISGLG